MGKTARLAPLVTPVTTESLGRMVNQALLAQQGQMVLPGLLVLKALRVSKELLDQPAQLEQLAK
jgi:hypothetical protein